MDTTCSDDSHPLPWVLSPPQCVGRYSQLQGHARAPTAVPSWCRSCGSEEVSSSPRGVLSTSSRLCPGLQADLDSSCCSSCPREEDDIKGTANFSSLHEQDRPDSAQGMLWLHLLHHVGHCQPLAQNTAVVGAHAGNLGWADPIREPIASWS